jgi:hypothetical protein
MHLGECKVYLTKAVCCELESDEGQVVTIPMSRPARSSVSGGFASEIDTTLIPPETQYGATLGKAKKRNRLRYAGFTTPCNPLQHTNYHSQLEQG